MDGQQLSFLESALTDTPGPPWAEVRCCHFTPSTMGTAATATSLSAEQPPGVAELGSRLPSSERCHEPQCPLIHYFPFAFDRMGIHICRYEP